MSRRKKWRLRSVFLWHRYMGLGAALFVLILAVSGALLNHTEALDLDDRAVQNAVLLDWYGLALPPVVSYRAGSSWVSQAGTGLYLNDTALPDAKPLIGAVALDGQLVVAGSDRLLLLTTDGALIERLTSLEGLPAPVRAVGADAAGALLLRTADGVYRPDETYSEWRQTAAEAVRWSTPEPAPPDLRDRIVGLQRGAQLSWEKVILDLHTGRILGTAGVYLMDGAAVLLTGLAFTGLWHWIRRQRK